MSLRGYASEWLWPVAGAPQVRGLRLDPLLDVARTRIMSDAVAASATLHRLLLEEDHAESPDPLRRAVLEIDAGYAHWRRGDVGRALEHFDAAVSSQVEVVAHRARLNRACCLAELGFPDVPGATASDEVCGLLGGPLDLAARVALAAIQARSHDTVACRGTLAELDAQALPPDLEVVHGVNRAAVLVAAQDPDAAEDTLDALPERDQDPLARAVLMLARGAVAVVQAMRQRPRSAARAARVARAKTLLVAARADLMVAGAPDRLLGDCARTLGSLHLRAGMSAGEEDQIAEGLALHWEALEYYRRRPELRRERGSQWLRVALCYDSLAARDGSQRWRFEALAHTCYERATAELVADEDPFTLAELDLAHASLLVERDAAAALMLVLPAALYLDGERFRLAGAEARRRWSAVCEDAWDTAMEVAASAGRSDVEAAIVVWRRLSGARVVEQTGPVLRGVSDASLLTPPPRVLGVHEVLEPFAVAAGQRYGASGPWVGETTIDLMPSAGGCGVT